MPSIKISILYALSCWVNIIFAAPSGIDTVNHFKEMRKGISANNAFINPLLDCYELDHSNLKNMRRMQKLVESKIAGAIAENKATSISVYYRDLKNGHWLGVKENEKYSPASLLKLPALIAALKQAEENPEYLHMRLYCEATKNDYSQNVDGKKFSLEVGKTYSIEELLEYMIVYSDNQSAAMVLSSIAPEFLSHVFSDLGIDILNKDVNTNILSVREYASYYRILYNATYLNKAMSNKALEILCKSKFKLGIVAGIPEGTVVAHKFGERGYANSNEKQFHDTGIIYKPNQPFLLCVMVKGTSFQVMEKVVADITHALYHFK